VDPVANQHALQQIDKLHMDWRGLLGALLALLYGAQQRTLGLVLSRYQCHAACLPGLSELRVQPSIPYQHIDASVNANVGAHVDKNDLIGTTIWWLCCQGSRTAAPVTSSKGGVQLGGAFLMYDVGMKFEVGHLSHVWCRSDQLVHGTIRNAGIDTRQLSRCLCGIAFANHKLVTKKALEVLTTGGPKTWARQQETDKSCIPNILPHTMCY
jgi:hypothetical protein